MSRGAGTIRSAERPRRLALRVMAEGASAKHCRWSMMMVTR